MHATAGATCHSETSGRGATPTALKKAEGSRKIYRKRGRTPASYKPDCMHGFGLEEREYSKMEI